MTDQQTPDFHLRDWLTAQDTAPVDDSLDDRAARLFLLNRALTSSLGPALAALVVYSPPHAGLDVLLEYASASDDPRLAAMALANLLQLLNGPAWQQTQLSLADHPPPDDLNDDDASEDDDLGDEAAASKHDDDNQSDDGQQCEDEDDTDLLSAAEARVRIAATLPSYAKLFLDRAADGDFCPDFLFYILTLLMELSKDCDNFPAVSERIAPVPTVQFLKAVMRSWKTPTRADHLTTDDKDALSLGCLVSCYLRSLCSRHPDCHDGEIGPVMDDALSAPAAAQPVGLDALISIRDWAIKFIVMRLCQAGADRAERAALVAVLSECASRSRQFAHHLLELSILPTLRRCFQTGLSSSPSSDAHSDPAHSPRSALARLSDESVAHTVLPYVLLLNTLIDVVLPERVRPGQGIAAIGTDANPAQTLVQAIWPVLDAGIRLVLQARVPDSFDGLLFLKSVIAVVSRFVASVWRVVVAVPRSNRVRLLTAHVQRTITDLCSENGGTWPQALAADLAPIRIGLLLCDKVASATRSDLPEYVRLLEESDEDEYDFEDGEDVFGTTRSRANGVLNVRRRPSDPAPICETCFANHQDVQLCRACRRVSFCDSQHQLQFWKAGHQHECSFFQNRLEGCSFTLRGERVEGLQKAEGVARSELPFAGIDDSQRKELFVLGFQLPGVFIETFWEGRVIEVRYVTRHAMFAKLRYVSNPVERKATAGVLTACLSIPAERCFLYVRADGMSGAETLRLYTGSSDESQCLSAVLL